MVTKKLRKLIQISLAVVPGLLALLALMLFMGAPRALGAPLPQASNLSVSKQGTSNWEQRIKLVFTGTVNEDLTDFPVLVVLNSSRISYTHTQDAGQDIRFVDAEGNLLPHEIEHWDENENSYVWVNVSSISTTTDYIWMYYHNPAAPDAQNPTAVWSNGYAGVWHFNYNQLNATTGQDAITASVTAIPNGRIAGGMNFTDGPEDDPETWHPPGDYVEVGSDERFDNIFASGGTLMAWINPRGYGPLGYSRILDKSSTRFVGNGWTFRMYKGDPEKNTIRFDRDFSANGQDNNNQSHGGWQAPDDAINLNTWQLVALTYNDATTAVSPSIYINGVAQNVTQDSPSTGDTVSDADQKLFIGNFSGFIYDTTDDELDRAFDGLMDEVRVLTTTRSANWIAAQYRTMTDAFISYGSPEPTNAPAGGIVGAPFTYTLTVSNSGNLVRDVVVTDVLPSGANYVSGGTLISGGAAVSLDVGNVGRESTASSSFVITSCQLSLVNRHYQVASSSGGASAEGPLQISLLTPPTITAAITANPTQTFVAQTISFTGSDGTNGGPVISRHWNFGDGSTAQGSSASHAYSGAGSYTVTLTLTDTCGYTATTQRPVTITTPGPPALSFVDAPYTVSEAAGGITVTVGLNRVFAQPVTVTYVITTNGSATTDDFTPDSGLALIAPGQLTTSFTVQITNDNRVEPDETLQIQLTAAQNAIGVPLSTTVTILNDDTVALSLNKHSSAARVKPGERFTYTLVVSNSGNAPARNAVISDTLPGEVTLVPGSVQLWPNQAGTAGNPPTLAKNLVISAGGQVTVTLEVTATAGLSQGQVITNTAAVTSAETPLAVSDSVTTTVNGPVSISLAKSGPAIAAPGQALVFTFTVTNSGLFPLRVQGISDDVAGPPARVSGDTNLNNWLDLSETWLYTAGYVVPVDAPGLLLNTARVTATSELNQQVTASATHTTTIMYQPTLTLTKSGPLTASVGNVVTFNYYVSHGPLSDRSPITGITVVDDFAGPAKLKTSGNGDGWLDWGETWQFSASYVVAPTTPNPFTSEGLAAGRTLSDKVITATASHTIQLSGFNPKLFVDEDGPTRAKLGEKVQFTYTVINVNLLSLSILGFDELVTADIGDGSPLRNVSVTDSVAGAATYVSGDFNLNGQLDAAEAWVFTAAHTVTVSDTDPLVSVGTANTLDAENEALAATDTVSVDILHLPAVLLQATAPATATVGQSVGLTLTVSHGPASDNSAVNVTAVGDDRLGQGIPLAGGDTNGNNRLDGGEVWTYTFSYTVTNSDYPQLVHTSTVQGADKDLDALVADLGGSIKIERPGGGGGSDGNRVYLPVITKNLLN